LAVRQKWQARRPVELEEILRRIQGLLEQRQEEVVADPGGRNFRCEDCSACYDCRFCVRCDACEECTYCEDSVDCAGCTQCRRCLDCEGSSYCEDSRACVASKYLVLCVECAECTHCLGCVGLTGAEFHVLNQRVARRDYFELAKRVQAELAVRAQGGWRPEVIGLLSLDDTTTPWSIEPEEADSADEREEPSPWLEERPAERRRPASPREPKLPTVASARPRAEDSTAGTRTTPEPAPRSLHAANGGATPTGGLRRGRRPRRRLDPE
jgi:hypothetical protein